jgi:serine/threonine protein kinase
MNHPHLRPLPTERTDLPRRDSSRRSRCEGAAFGPSSLERRVEPARALASSTQVVRGPAAAPRTDAPEAPPAERDEGAEPLPPGTLVGGRYELEALVGTGAFGHVYRARDAMVEGHVVALKLHHARSESPAARALAMRELRVVASVFHPSVVQYKDHGWYRGRLWFAMPYYLGETLEARIARGPLSRSEAHRIFEPLARALAALHAVGIRHQDLKPDNVFLARLPGSEGEVLPVLLDLGVAATETERVMGGTPPYFAPEVASFFADRPEQLPPITPKADVFSLALTLRNALEPSTRDEPGDEDLDAFIARRAARVPSPPTGHALRDLAPAFRRWLSPEPAARPSAEELAIELRVLRERGRRPAVALRVAALAGLGALLLLLGQRLDGRRGDRAESAGFPGTSVAHAQPSSGEQAPLATIALEDPAAPVATIALEDPAADLDAPTDEAPPPRAARHRPRRRRPAPPRAELPSPAAPTAAPPPSTPSRSNWSRGASAPLRPKGWSGRPKRLDAASSEAWVRR